MAEQFSKNFTGASDDLMKSVQSFQPTVNALSGLVGDAQRTVVGAVEKLNAHGDVMLQMSSAASNIKQAAEAFGKMKETLLLSATQNEDAAKAQLAAAKSNETVAEHFGRIGEGLPAMRQTLEDAARVIGSLGSPIAELHALLEGQPELQRQIENTRATSESERSQLLLSMSGDLAEKVGIAAKQFAEVGVLADKLTSSATSLEQASKELSAFGSNVAQASKGQLDASVASREAAASGERTARALEPIPGAIDKLTSGLESAGSSVRSGAVAAGESYRELIDLQKQWFAGAQLGLRGMKDQLESIIESYGDQIDERTNSLMQRWNEEVESCLGTYSSQVEALQGGLDELQSAISKLSK